MLLLLLSNLIKARILSVAKDKISSGGWIFDVLKQAAKLITVYLGYATSRHIVVVARKHEFYRITHFTNRDGYLSSRCLTELGVKQWFINGASTATPHT